MGDKDERSHPEAKVRPKPNFQSSQYLHWDFYASAVSPSGDYWPGDEWGNEATWKRNFEVLFLPNGVHEWKRCVEIGPGSGKYTLLVLKNSSAHVIAADISAGYLAHFTARMKAEGLTERVTEVLLNEEAITLRKHIEHKGWAGSVDCVYSIDAMVHVDLQYLIIYLVTAAHAMKRGGKLVLTLANACSEKGFRKLVDVAPRMLARIHTHNSKFEWMSPDLVTSIFPRLGFDIDVLHTKERDMLLAATLVRKLDDDTILKCIM